MCLIFFFVLAYICHAFAFSSWPDAGVFEARSPDKAHRLRFISPTHNRVLHCSDPSKGADIKVLLGLVMAKSSPYINDRAGLSLVFYSRESGSILSNEFYETRRMTVLEFFQLNGVFFENVKNGSYDLGVGLFSNTDSHNALARVVITVHVDCSHSLSQVQAKEDSNCNGGKVNIDEVRSTNYMTLAAFNRSDYFHQVYDTNFWTTHVQERVSGMDGQSSWVSVSSGSTSGPGSSLTATRLARAAISDIIQKASRNSTALHGLPFPGDDGAPRAVKPFDRVVDVPCGDMTWMDVEHLLHSNISYLGMDVVPSVIERNKAVFSERFPTAYADGRITFRQFDIAIDNLPLLRDTDLLIVRHLMFHLPAADNSAILWKISGSNIRWVLMSTYLRADRNGDDFILAVGHAVNLFRAPYCACDATLLYRDAEPDQYLGLWDLSSSPSCFIRADRCD